MRFLTSKKLAELKQQCDQDFDECKKLAVKELSETEETLLIKPPPSRPMP